LDTRGAEALRSIMGLCQLAAKHRAGDLDAACAKAMDAAARLPAFREIKNLLEAGSQAPAQIQMELREADPIIRPLDTYTDFIRHQTPGGDNLFPPEPKPPAPDPTLANPTKATATAAAADLTTIAGSSTAPAPAITPVSLTEIATTTKAS
jgi:hypothetical protein